MAIQHAMMVLGWYEHLPKEEMPPEWMWPFGKELEAWFEDVDIKRKERYGISDPDDEIAETVGNELAKGLM